MPESKQPARLAGKYWILLRSLTQTLVKQLHAGSLTLISTFNRNP
jgi:hypothetical protein